MNITFNGNQLIVWRTGKKVYSESRLLHQVKKELQVRGFDVIKKRMWKDGHLVSDTEHYIRDRKGRFSIWFPDYALRFSYEDYNRDHVSYQIEGSIKGTL